jgi:hypothetical protein
MKSCVCQEVSTLVPTHLPTHTHKTHITANHKLVVAAEAYTESERDNFQKTQSHKHISHEIRILKKVCYLKQNINS